MFLSSIIPDALLQRFVLIVADLCKNIFGNFAQFMHQDRRSLHFISDTITCQELLLFLPSSYDAIILFSSCFIEWNSFAIVCRALHRPVNGERNKGVHEKQQIILMKDLCLRILEDEFASVTWALLC